MKHETEKEQIIQAFDEAYEKLIISASAAEKRGKFPERQWGPREVLAHIAGWAAQATAQIPQVIAGIPDVTYYNDVQHAAVDEVRLGSLQNSLTAYFCSIFEMQNYD